MNPFAKRRLGATTVELTVLGIGGASIGSLHGSVAESDALAAIEAAYGAGARYFDTAPLYGSGLGEHRMGRILQRYRRDSFVLSTKVGRVLKPLPPGANERTHLPDWLPFAQVYDYSFDGTLRAFDDSLQRLGLGQIDIALIHDIDPLNHGLGGYRRRYHEAMEGAYPALARLRSEGVVKAIGVGVNDWRVCQRCAKAADFDCFLLAGRYSLLEQEALKSFLPLCERKGIAVIIGAPYNSGILARGAVRRTTHNYQAPSPQILRKVGHMEEICARHGVSLAAAALQFPLGHLAVVSVIPGVRSRSQVELNIRLMQEAIPEDFWHELVHERLLDAAAPIPKIKSAART
jgi:D-threo-aldose 1-dehydrogenase